MKEKPFLDLPNKAHPKLYTNPIKGEREFTKDEVLIFKNWIWKYFNVPPNKTPIAFEGLAGEINSFNDIEEGGISARTLQIIIYPEKKPERFPQTKQVRLTNLIVNFFNDKYRDTDEAILPVQNNSLTLQSLSNLPFNLENLTPETFENEIFNTQSLFKDFVFDYYLKFNNNYTVLKRVVANEIHIKPKEKLKIRFEGEFTNLTFDNIVDKANLGGKPILLKILAVGGVGKSTLLWHLIWKNCGKYTSYYLKSADPDCIYFLINNLTKSENTLLLFIDDLVTHQENRENLLRFGEAIAELTSTVPVVLVVSERFFRYEKFNRIATFESNFVEFYLPYSNVFIKKDFFERMFDNLTTNSDNLKEDFKSHCFKIFSNRKFESLIDATINLMMQIYEKIPVEIKKYKFDWDDWNDICPKDLKELYKIVAFFYQFGVKVPLDFVKEYFVDIRNVVGELSEMLSSLDQTPILLCEMNDGKPGLQLRHEKMGEWFFLIQNKKTGFDLGSDFFKTFFKNIYTESYSYLFRNIIRNNPEFIESQYSKLITNEKILEIIDNYLSLQQEDKLVEEDYKMLTEKHFILTTLGRVDESIEPLEIILKNEHTVNIFARTRLAKCIQESDPQRAEILVNEVLDVDNNNSYAIFLLYTIYYKSQNWVKFVDYELTIYNKAKSNIYFTNKWFFIIDKYFDKLYKSTIRNLIELYSVNISLGLNIAEILIDKKEFSETSILFNKFENDLDSLSCNSRNYFAKLIIKMYNIQNIISDKYLITAEKILKENYIQNRENAETILLLAKLFTLKKSKENFRNAIHLMDELWMYSKSSKTFLNISRFYRNYAKQYSTSEIKDLPKSITVLLKGINFIKTRMSAFAYGKSIYEIELSLFYSELIKSYDYHSCYLSDPTSKYSSIISKAEIECELLLKKIISQFAAKLPKSNAGVYSNYIVRQREISIFSKTVNIYYEYYSNKINRYKTIEESYKINTYLKIINLFEHALYYDSENAALWINYVNAKILIEDENLETIVLKMNFENFNTKQKAKLCRILFLKGQDGIANKIISKFGRLNSSDLYVKNDLAFCYYKAKSWGYAINIFSGAEVNDINHNSVKVIKNIIREMPSDTEERLKDIIFLSELVLKYNNEESEFLRNKICKSIFIWKGENASLSYFSKNLKYFKNSIKKGIKPKFAFKIKREEWYPELLEYNEKKVDIIKTIVEEQDRFKKGLELVEILFKRMFGYYLNYSNIPYNHQGVNEFQRKVQSIFRRGINILIKILEKEDANSTNSFRLIFQLLRFNNPLFNKTILKKIIFPESTQVEVFQEEIVKYFSLPENNKSDSDILRTIGRYYLGKYYYKKANSFFKAGLRFSKGSEQKCYSNINLADLIITKIEKQV